MEHENDQEITLSFTLTEDACEQLAQFCKRSTFNTFFELTEEHLPYEERKRRSYLMIGGIEAIQAELREAGFSPR